VGSTCCAQRKIGLEIKSRRSEVALIEASARVVEVKFLYGCCVPAWELQIQNTLMTTDGDTWDDDRWCHIVDDIWGITFGVAHRASAGPTRVSCSFHCK